MAGVHVIASFSGHQPTFGPLLVLARACIVGRAWPEVLGFRPAAPLFENNRHATNHDKNLIIGGHLIGPARS
jgi:hypothetical protein